jgi:hypothetical protein
MPGKNLMCVYETAFIVKNLNERDALEVQAHPPYFVRSLESSMMGCRFKEIYISFELLSDLNEDQKKSYLYDVIPKIIPHGKITYMSLEDMKKHFKLEEAKYAAFVLSAMNVVSHKDIFEEVYYDTALTKSECTEYLERAIFDGYINRANNGVTVNKTPPKTLSELEKMFSDIDLILGEYVTDVVDKMRSIEGRDKKVYDAMLLNIVYLSETKYWSIHETLAKQTCLSHAEISRHVTDALIRGYIEKSGVRGTNKEFPISLWKLSQDKTFDASYYLINDLKEKYIRMKDNMFNTIAYNCFVHNILCAFRHGTGLSYIKKHGTGLSYIKNNTNIDNDEFDVYRLRAEADGFISATGTQSWNKTAPLTLGKLKVLIGFNGFPEYDYLISKVREDMTKECISSDDNVDASRYRIPPKTVSFQDIDTHGWNVFNERYPTPTPPTVPHVLKMKVSDMDLSRWDRARDEIKQYQEELVAYRTKAAYVKQVREAAFFELLMKRFGVWQFFGNVPNPKRIDIQKMYNRAVIVAKHNRKKAPTNYAEIAVKFEEFMNIGLV